MGRHRCHVDDHAALAGRRVEHLVDVERAERVGPHDVVGGAHARAHPRGVDDRGERPEVVRGVEQVCDRPPVGDVTVDDRGSHPEVFQGCGRGRQPVLPDVAEDHGVVAADDLGRGQTHAARAACDYRHSIHIWTVYVA